MKIVKYLKNHIAAVFIIFCLLIVQAFCELSLPAYTSDIVDVGIQNGGIEYAAPAKIRQETLLNLELFMTDDDAAYIKEAYVPDGGGILSLRDGEDPAALDARLSLPMAMLAKIESGGEYQAEFYSGKQKTVQGAELENWTVRLAPRSFQLVFYRKR